MPRDILFSLPVHERPDILEGQISNIMRYCPGSGVAVHVSAAYDGDLTYFQKLEKYPGVFINPKSAADRARQGLISRACGQFPAWHATP